MAVSTRQSQSPTRRQLLKMGGLLAASSVIPLSKMGAQQVENSKRGTSPLLITKVEPVIISTPPLKDSLDEVVTMPPLGLMTEQAGLRNRLNHNFPSRNDGYSFTTLVKITTNQGIIGWGEAHAPLGPA